MYTVISVDSNNKFLFQNMANGLYDKKINGLFDKDTFLCVGAKLFNKPVGIATAIIKDRICIVQKIYVPAHYRNIGIGSSLIQEIEKIALSKNVFQLNLSYNDKMTNKDAVKRIIEKCEIKDNFNRVRTYSYKPKDVLTSKWAQTNYYNELLKNKIVTIGTFEVFLWSELKEKEKEFVISEKGKSYPVWLDPFSYDDIDEKFSIGVRDNNSLVGWVLTKNGHFKLSYIMPKYRRGRLYMRLITILLHLYNNAGVDNVYTDVNLKNTYVIRFMDHAFSHFLQSVFDTVTVEKIINKN